MVVPPGIVYDDTTKYFFRDLMQCRSLVSFYHFENEEFLFPAVDHRVVFSPLTLTGPDRPHRDTDFAFFCRRVEQLHEPDRHFTLTADEIRLMNPNTGTCPIFRSKRDAEINKAIYRRVPVLIREGQPEAESLGHLSFMAILHMANDSGLFRTREQLEADGWTLDGNRFRRGDRTYLAPLRSEDGPPLRPPLRHLRGPDRLPGQPGQAPRVRRSPARRRFHASVLPWYWVPAEDVEGRLNGRWDRQWLLGWRDVCRNTDARTVIASLIPYYGVGHKFPLVIPDSVLADPNRPACMQI